MANVTVGINSKFDSKGVDDSKKSLDSLKSSLTSIASMAKNMFNFAILDKAKTVFQSLSTGAIDIYKTNQNAYQNLTNSISKNNRLVASSFNNITKFTSKLSSNSMFGGDVLNEQAAFLANLGMTEKQIEDILQAAVDLSSTGFINLDSAVKNLSGTLQGKLEGDLAKIIPELQNMNKEALIGGDAIDIIKDKYEGFAKTIKDNTLEGKENRFQSATDDIKNSIGLVSGNIKGMLLDEINPVLEKIGEWANENIPKIGAMIIASVQVVRDIFKSVGTNITGLTDKGRWTVFFNNLGQLSFRFGNVLAKLLESIFSNSPQFLVKGVLKVIPAIKGIIDNIGIMLDTATRDMQINTLAEEYVQQKYRPGSGKSQDELRQEGIRLATETVDNRITAALKKAGVKLPEGGQLIPDDLQEALAQLGEGLKDTIFSFGDAVTGGNIQADFEKYVQESLAKMTNLAVVPISSDGREEGGGEEKKNVYLLKDLGSIIQKIVGIATGKISYEMGTLVEKIGWLGYGIDAIPFSISWLGDLITKGTDLLGGWLGSGIKALRDRLIDPVNKVIDGIVAPIAAIGNGINTTVTATIGALGNIIEGTINKDEGITKITEGFAEGGLMGGIVAIIEQVVGALTKIENFAKVLNPLGTILDRVTAVLEPLVNELFAPFVIILESVGDIIGNVLAPVFELLIAVLHPILDVIVTIFNVLKPLFALFNMFATILISVNPLLMLFNVALGIVSDIILLIYNKVILPIANGLIWIFTQVENAFVWLYNSLSDLLKNITGGIINIGRKSSASYEERKLKEISNESVDYTQPSEEEKKYSGSGSYTAPKEVIVNIYFNHSFVNGDAREIALMLEQELEAAHALGY